MRGARVLLHLLRLTIWQAPSQHVHVVVHSWHRSCCHMMQLLSTPHAQPSHIMSLLSVRKQ